MQTPIDRLLIEALKIDHVQDRHHADSQSNCQKCIHQDYSNPCEFGADISLLAQKAKRA
jgi:predicted YcjX-like family ATPase